MAGDLVRNNNYIADYINSHPLAAQLSSDDYGNLDTASQAIGRIPILSAPANIGSKAAGDFGTGFKAGFGDQNIGSWAYDPKVDYSSVINRLGFAGWTTLGAIPEIALRTIAGVLKGVTDAAAGGAEQAYQEAGGSEAEAKSFGRGIGGIGEMLTSAPHQFLPEVGAKAPSTAKGLTLVDFSNTGPKGVGSVRGTMERSATYYGEAPEVVKSWTDQQLKDFLVEKTTGIAQEVADIVAPIKPYIDAGKDPPVGLHPEIDKTISEVSAEDVSALIDAVKESQASLTKERNPDMYANFVRQHVGDQTIGVHADVVRSLYGDKPPVHDDSILGFVPNLADKIITAEATGGYIDIPMADYIAKVDPQVAKALEEFTRVRPAGVSKGEAKDIKASEQVEAYPPAKAEETVRDAARLDRKEQKLELRRAQLDQQQSFPEAAHSFEIVDPTGTVVGEVYIAEEAGGKRLYVDDIRGVGGVGPNSIGPRQLRDILNQLRAEFPNAQELMGYRVSGARDKAGTWETNGRVSIKLAEPTASDHLFQILLDDRIERLGEKTPVGDDTFTATSIPEDRWQNFERTIVKQIDEELQRLGVSDIDVEAAHKITNAKGELIRGLYQSYENARPTILFALTADDPVGVLRHEVMHDLRTRGFLSEQEWGVLEKAAIDGDWMKQHETKERYADIWDNQEALLEEAIADHFADWRRGGKPTDSIYSKVFQKIDQLIEKIRALLRQVFGTENWKDIFDRIEKGEVADREPQAEFGDVTKQAKPTQPELPFTRRMEDRDVFAEAAAAGMTKDQYLRYMKLIAERHREDLAKESERAIRDAKRRQTQEWKDNSAAMREQVVEQINARPDIATDNLLREQRLFGRKTDPVHLGSDYLTAEQKAGLPKDYVAKVGVHPDDVAALTGYASGTELVQGLMALDAARKASGLRPIEYTRRLITAETERQMEAKFGSLSENILEEAKEQVLSETQLDLLHEEVLAAGLKAGAEFPITKAQMKEWVAERFSGMEAKDVSSDKLLADAGRAGRMAEDALLKGDPAEAFRQKQRQYLAVAMARLGKDFEKAQAQFEKLAERIIRKEPKGYDKDFVNFAQGMLARSGYNIKRNLNELADSLERSGFTSFDEFVQSKIGDGWELYVAEELRQGSGKTIEKMTTAEFMGLKESLDSLAHVGREVGKIDIAGQKEDFAEWKEKVLENIRSLPVRDKNNPIKQRLRWDASMVRMEEVAKDLDLREELGPLWNALIRPMAESKHTEYTLLEALSKKFTEMKGDRPWQRSLNETIDQNFFVDPYDGTLFDLTRQHMLQIMLNFGNRSNIDKFTRGYVGKAEAPAFEVQLWDMIHKNANKEDWEWVQGIWDIFDGWKKQTGKLYYDLSGRQPKWIDPSPITTPHGDFAGGYYPIIYDRLRSNINAIEEKVAPNALFGNNYTRATTANSYTKERTGYADRIQFQTSIEQVAGRMQQIIHDISYRRAVIEASKVIYDREIRGAIRKHYGMEYEKQLDPWLKDIANHFNNDEVANDFASAVMRRARSNLVGHALGLNLKVILSPAVAKMNPADAMRVWGDYAASEKLAYEKSFEIPHTFRNIDRDFRERLEASVAQGGWNEYQAEAVRWAFMPVVKVEQQFRIITFVNEYQKGIAKGMSEGDAAVLADSYVRERHGSTGLPDMPSIMRSSEGMKIATMFYGYFSAMYNWQRQIKGNVSRGEWMKGLENIWGAVLIPAAFGAVLFNQSKESDSWGKHIAKAIVLQPLSTLVFVRDFANFFIEGNPSRTPLATAAASVASIISDAKNVSEGKKVKKPIQHIGNVIGLATGLPMAQLSRTAQFGADVSKGQQRPRNIAEWARGIITGEARLKK